jgi:hypothetical protein
VVVGAGAVRHGQTELGEPTADEHGGGLRQSGLAGGDSGAVLVPHVAGVEALAPHLVLVAPRVEHRVGVTVQLGAGGPHRPEALHRDRSHRLQEGSRVGAAAWAAEQLPYLVGEPARDRQPDQLVVVSRDRRAFLARVHLEMRRHGDDLELWERDFDRDLHVMDGQRVGVGLYVQPGWFLIADRTLDQ